MRQSAFPLLLAGLVLCFPATLAAKKVESTTSVDCTDPDPGKHDSINTALLTAGDALIIDISGICHEDVDIRRDNVTLIGTDRDLDGIRAVDTEDPFGAAVRVRDARSVRLENLQITGGTFTGLEVQDTLGRNDVVNCRIEANGSRGIHIVSSFLFITDTVIRGNGTTVGLGRGLQVGFASSFSCDGCTIENNHPGGNDVGIYALRGGTGSVFNGSTVSARYALVTDAAGLVTCTDSALTAEPFDDGFGPFGFVAWADTGSRIFLRNCALDGSLRAERESRIEVQGSAQSANTSVFGNEVLRDSQLEVRPRAGIPSSLVGTTVFREFSTGVFRTGPAGDLVCEGGSDAICDAGVTGSSSGCGFCPLP